MQKQKNSFVKNTYILTSLLVVLVALAVVYVNSITGFIFTIPTAYTHPALTSYYGSEPKIDGMMAKGEWDDAGVATMQYEGGFFKVYSKHDKQNLFFLLRWQDTNPSWRYSPHLYFEQDGYAHDHILDGKNDYFFALDPEHCYERGSTGSWSGYYNNWITYGGEFEAQCLHSIEKNEWYVEIKHPLTNNVLKMLAIQITDFKKPYELGFAIINYQNNVAGGFAAQSWNWPHDQTTTGSMEAYTVDGDTSTWGNLNIAWARKPVA